MKRSWLKRISPQKQKDNEKYAAAKEEWRKKRIEIDGYHRCQFENQDGLRCTVYAMTPPHHKKGRRGSLLWDKRYFMAVCFVHHDWIETHKREARKRKYILYT